MISIYHVGFWKIDQISGVWVFGCSIIDTPEGLYCWLQKVCQKHNSIWIIPNGNGTSLTVPMVPTTDLFINILKSVSHLKSICLDYKLWNAWQTHTSIWLQSVNKIFISLLEKRKSMPCHLWFSNLEFHLDLTQQL